MSKRTYEDVEKERTLAKISRDLDEIKYNTSSHTDGVAVFSGILGGIGSLFRPLRRPLPRSINYVIDFAAAIIGIVGIISAFTGSMNIVYSLLMMFGCTIIFASSPYHDKKK